MPPQRFSGSCPARRPNCCSDGDATVVCATPSSVGSSKEGSGDASTACATPSSVRTSVGSSKEGSGDATTACAIPSSVRTSVGSSKEGSGDASTACAALSPVRTSVGSSKEGSGDAAVACATPAPALPIRPSEANMPTTSPFHSCHFMTFPLERLLPRLHHQTQRARPPLRNWAKQALLR